LEKINSNHSAILVQLHNSDNSSISVNVALGGDLDYSETLNWFGFNDEIGSLEIKPSSNSPNVVEFIIRSFNLAFGQSPSSIYWFDSFADVPTNLWTTINTDTN
jgi:hypothetical protein